MDQTQLHTNIQMDYSTQSHPDFHTFLRDWMIRLEFYLNQLLQLHQFLDQQDESKLKQVINQVKTHYHEYFLAKAQVYHHNVFLILSPPWFSSFERTFLWLAGFKPSLAISVVKSCGVDFSSTQAEQLEKLMVETKHEERMMTERLAVLQQQAAEASMLAQARMDGKEVNGVVNEADIVVDRFAEEMVALVECADYLREKTAANVIGILTTAQTVRFLAAVAQLQLRIRRWGQQMDAQTRGDIYLPSSEA